MAVLNRKDTDDILLLSPAETFPDKFFPAEVFQHAIEELSVVPEGSRVFNIHLYILCVCFFLIFYFI